MTRRRLPPPHSRWNDPNRFKLAFWLALVVVVVILLERLV